MTRWTDSYGSPTCPAFTYVLKMQDPNLSLDTTIFTTSLTNPNFKIDISANAAKVGTYNLEFIGSLMDLNNEPYIQKSELFTVKITNNCTSTSIVTNVI